MPTFTLPSPGATAHNADYVVSPAIIEKIVHVSRGDAYRLQVKSPFARYAVVCSTPYLENLIDSMTPEQAEQARINMKAN